MTAGNSPAYSVGLRAYLAAVILLGVAATGIGGAELLNGTLSPNWIAVGTFAGALLVAEIQPVRWIRGREASFVTVSLAYAFALTMSLSGLAAVPIVAAASIIGDLSRRIDRHKVAFNAATAALSTAAAAAALRTFDAQHAVASLDVSAEQVLGIVLAGLSMYAVAAIPLNIAIGLATGDGAVTTMRRDFLLAFGTDGLLLVQAPVLVGAAAVSPLLLPFAMVLTGTVIRSGRHLAAAEDRAHHDPLTGLANRDRFTADAEQVLARGIRHGLRPTVVVLDLDGFKPINDTLGHATGDIVLQRVAEQLQARAPHGATVARLGGDEFAVLLPDTTTDARPQVQHFADAFPVQLIVNDVTVEVEASMGYAQVTTEDEGVGALLRAADAAMYASKRTGHRIEEAELGADTRRLRDLADAIANDNLALHFQPILDVRTQAVLAVEALLRWDHPDDGPIAPNVLIPLVEASALLTPLTRWVLRNACKATRQMHDRGHRVGVHVNISIRNLADPTFADDVLAALHDHQLPSKWLTLEITDSSGFQPDDARRTVARLTEAGVGVALDGFGNDSVMVRIRTMQLTALKVDQSLLTDATHSNYGRAVLRTLGAFGRELGLPLIVEGVETAEHLHAAAGAGIERAQGFGLAKPLSFPETLAWLDGRLSLDQPLTPPATAAVKEIHVP
ncbi:diguanylate cyclase/phosphodiesterase (GGDEF & EAL domains) with PAS/PAC sensor(s) (plasmid) [Euzebya pacifica]|uniref:Diguanylate cyclase/phosphodiesterase (GGDEF & EAL domains) with PAS/PAC sensor(S) n=1 Tax=Euzebya pacifica TaxID=1608957 RepID=A0A346Y5P9_9ACTN|nr:bifunctional diguanylate cyclase/phosphodiesterase [Euzebya pacifica]AXV09796.1 diguanylate cyclase/phosphodiesterase (GGDEF & EAL domains) with PAS/PAC sensor(s) [Euzebya pacifica]